jgi:hypothetical protein
MKAKIKHVREQKPTNWAPTCIFQLSYYSRHRDPSSAQHTHKSLLSYIHTNNSNATQAMAFSFTVIPHTNWDMRCDNTSNLFGFDGDQLPFNVSALYKIVHHDNKKVS